MWTYIQSYPHFYSFSWRFKLYFEHFDHMLFNIFDSLSHITTLLITYFKQIRKFHVQSIKKRHVEHLKWLRHINIIWPLVFEHICGVHRTSISEMWSWSQNNTASTLRVFLYRVVVYSHFSLIGQSGFFPRIECQGKISKKENLYDFSF